MTMLRPALFIYLLTLFFISSATADELPRITVQSDIFKPMADEELNPALTVLNKEEIEQNLATTLGETLRNLPGISSTHF